MSDRPPSETGERTIVEPAPDTAGGHDLWSHLARITHAYQTRGRRIERLHGFLSLCADLTDSLGQPLDEAATLDLLTRAVDRLIRCVDSEAGSLLAVDEDRKDLVFVITRGHGDALEWRRMGMNQGVGGWVAHNCRTAIVNGARSDERYFPEYDREFGFLTRSVLAVPVLSGKRLLGVLETINKREGLYNHHDRTMIMLVARLFGDHLRRMVRERDPANTLVRLAEHDRVGRS